MEATNTKAKNIKIDESLITGEAPDSDDNEETESTVGGISDIPGNSGIDKEAAVKTLQVEPELSLKTTNQLRKANKSLHKSLTCDFLNPTINNSIKSLETMSYNLSNYQASVQQSLFQFRKSDENLSKILEEINKIDKAQYLSNIKIQKQ